MSKPDEEVNILTATRVNFTHGLIEYKTTAPSLEFELISRFESGLRDRNVHRNRHGKHQVGTAYCKRHMGFVSKAFTTIGPNLMNLV